MERIRAGYVLVRNPMNASQVSRIVLNPEVVDCIVFWTKDAGNIMHKLAALDELGYRYCFQYTVTPYGNDLERYLRPKKEILENFKDLSVRLGKKRIWVSAGMQCETRPLPSDGQSGREKGSGSDLRNVRKAGDSCSGHGRDCPYRDVLGRGCDRAAASL